MSSVIICPILGRLWDDIWSMIHFPNIGNVGSLERALYKYVTMDAGEYSDNGIRQVNVLDWLLLDFGI